MSLAFPALVLGAAACGSDSPAPAGGGAGMTGGSGGAGGGGAAGTGGVGGGGTTAAAYTVIDDAETDTGSTTTLDKMLITSLSSNLQGGWFVYGDPGGPAAMLGMMVPGTITLTVAEADAHPNTAGMMSTKALHATAGSYPAYVGFGTELLAMAPFDGSTFTGIAFSAKLGSTAGVASSLILRVSSPETYANAMPLLCDPAAPDGDMHRCDDDFSTVPAVLLTTDWKQFKVNLADLRQGGWGNGPADHKLKTNMLYAIKFAFDKPVKPIDVWVDDVAFFK